VKPRSLAGRLRWLLLVSTVVVLGFIAATTYRGFSVAYMGQLDRLLQVMAVSVAALAGQSPPADELARGIEAIVTSPWRGPGNEVRVWFEGASGEVYSNLSGPRRELALRIVSEEPPPDLGATRAFDVRHGQRLLRAAWARHPVGPGVAHVLILHPANWEQRRLWTLVVVMILSGALLVGLVALVASPLARSTLAPLERVRARIATIEPDRPLPPSKAAELPPELRPLERDVDELVAKYSAAMERQRALVAEAAHQLRTPLAIARSSLELAAESPAAPSETLRSELSTDLGRMQRLVDQLVTLSRVESGPLTASPGTIRLDGLLRELVAAHQELAAARDMRLECATLAECDLPGDDASLRLLFGTLLENALQYGPPRATVRVALEHGPAGQCTASVQDEGGSIPPESLERLFERFVRADETREHHPTGAGLGLTIAREIARRHGGWVWATTVPGLRTTFHVRLPTSG
jgi:signal transduction histidine kinase